jgi:hypothetical protein
MKQINQIKLKLFKENIDKFKSDVEKDINNRKKKFAVAMLAKLINSSPFFTGAYIDSHRVGINSVDTSFSFFPHRSYRSKSRSAVEASALMAGKAKINRSKLFDTIYISNSVPHAINVELIGWKTSPPYHVYGLTYEYGRHMVKHYMEKNRL